MRRVSLFRQVLGIAFEQLPSTIRELHDGAESQWFSGACDIERGSNPLARFAAWIAGMPPAAAAIELRIQIEADEAGEHWRRYFGGRLMHSRLTSCEGLLIERLGPLTIAFRLAATSRDIRWTPQGGRVLGVPVPVSFFRGVSALESLTVDRYTFDVTAALPIIGLVIRYRGWLQSDVA